MASDSLYRRLLWPVFIPSTLLGVAGGATAPVQVVAAIQLGASASLGALMVAGVGALGLLTTVWAGRLIDRFGERRAMLAATIWAALVTAGSITALIGVGPASLPLFIVSNLLRAPAMNVWGLARQAFTADHVSTGEVGRAMTGLGGTMRIGALLGPALGGVLLLRLPLWSVYILSLVCALLALVVLYTPRLGGSLDGADAAARAEKAARVASGEPGSQATPPAVDWTRVALAGVAMVTLALARMGQPVVVQLWGVHMGLDASRISLIVAVGAAIEIGCMFPGGHLKDRLGRAIILTTCLLVYGIGFMLMPLLSGLLSVAGMVVAVVVMAVGNGLGAGVNMTIGADLSPSEGRGRFLGVWALFSNVGALGGPLLISGLVKVASVAAAVTSVGAIAVAGAVWVVVFARRMALPRNVRRSEAST